ncbi:hypothetical protein PRECH8_27870 [Insulibacter thermoxylanivorax]|jgi:hypothetical protein|uniref:Uncharacterized protein n=1 Tax=Insulibacter thermoxylanivorax TaxID=2749268 RepID=A0A916QEV5_9BACL|nr:hypothetical protein [Insulibacter thermoxylanivorax]GFR39491.1 hypothetical protein PRECH8_27870 [Insulibacter thermoxylanivorax]
MDLERLILMIRLLNVCVSVVGSGMLLAAMLMPEVFSVSPAFPAIIAFSWIVTIFFNPAAKELWEKWKSNMRS